MTSVEEKEVTSEQQIVEQPPPADEQAVTSETNDSPSGNEKGDEEQKSEDKGQVDTKEEVEPTAKPSAQPVDSPPRKLRCIDPIGTVDLLVGRSGIGASKPMTVPTFFENSFKTWPNVKALCWKDKKEDPWKSLTYAQYKKLIYNVAKSFLKVMWCSMYFT